MSPERESRQLAATIRISSAADMVAGLAALFGFRPRESLIFIEMQPSGQRLGFRARVDLPVAHEVPRAVDDLVYVAARNQVSAAVVLCHTAAPKAGSDAAVALAHRFEVKGVEVRDVILLDDHRFWSLICESASCCPPEGRPYDAASSLLVAEAVGLGQRIVTDRNELAAEFAAPEHATARRMSKEYDRVRASLVRQHGVDPAKPGARLDLAALRAGAGSVKQLITRAVTTGAGELSDETVATLGIWCRNITVRDVAWSQVDCGDPEQHLFLWSTVARRTIAPFEPAVLSLAAFCAWLSGDGARASCALERALQADADYSMAQLIGTVLANALPPTMWQPIEESAVWPVDASS